MPKTLPLSVVSSSFYTTSEDMWNGWLLCFRFGYRVRLANMKLQLQLRPIDFGWIGLCFEIEVAQLYIWYKRVYSFLLRVSSSLQ